MPTILQCFWGFFFLLSLLFIHSTSLSHVYIVYLGLNRIVDPSLTTKLHIQLLSNVFSSREDARQSKLYSYKHSFSGFSAKLNSTQATTLANMKGVIAVFKSRIMRPHTTRSWDFMGLTVDNSEVTPLQLTYGDDIIVGVLDSGVWPESESFHEEPCLGPIPSSWKGKCVKGEEFDPIKACNRKLIGARYYLRGFEAKFGPLNANGKSEYLSARDFYGHGTHTASTAVGSIVKNVSFLGFGMGTARGGAPRARLAVYKVCWTENYQMACDEADVLKGFDDALHDGVHVISVSFGVTPPLAPFVNWTADIGSFHAMQMGVSVVFSAGNDGPVPSLVQNVAPWATSVAASSIDRTFPTEILVNDDLLIMGEGFITSRINAKLSGARAFFQDGICHPDNWNKSKKASGKVILCFSTRGRITSDMAEKAALLANASGLIFVEPLFSQIADVDIIPTVRIDIIEGTKLNDLLGEAYWLPKVRIGPSKTVIGKSPAPVVADFSSRGPSSITPDILKPDVSAPGVNILAAWPPHSPPALKPEDHRTVNWNILSGTSMSCPHVSGAVALLKSLHPNWSPAVIRSAFITTAYTRDTTQDNIISSGTMKVADPFDVGAGHINPLKAMDPGLVYDMKTNDYIVYLCSVGYTEQQIKVMLIVTPGTVVTCPTKSKFQNAIGIANINYPSITVSNLQSAGVTIKRTVRNVGPRRTAVYFARIGSPDGVEAVVWPRVMIFSYLKEEMSYYVTLKPKPHKISQGRFDFGEIVWSDGVHHVRSPLVVCVNTSSEDPSAQT